MKHRYYAGLLLVATFGLAGLGYFLADRTAEPAAVLIRSSSSSATVKEPALPDIEKSLAQREYHITFDPENRKFQSPNRQHNLRAYYEPGVLTVRNRKDSAGHNFEFKLINQGIYADGKRMDLADKKSKVENSANTAEIHHSAFTEEYINSPEGIRQNFIIEEAPAETNELAVRLELKGFEAKEAGTNELAFYRSDLAGKSQYELSYKDLKCWDATGTPLEASLTYQNDRIQISVDVRGAAYPVTIDPIITNGNPGNAIKIPEANQTQAWFGGVVSSAGDVNGDGYSDVIVGAAKYDNGQVDEGAVFIYYGSASGINAAGPVMLQSDQKEARFGCYASSAGDINKDGFSDIIVGSFLYDKGQTNEGAAFVYYGSAQGISTTASVILESNQAEANMGNRVGMAGDVNGDGYSDVLVCAWTYDKGQTNEGVVFLYHGSAAGLNANTPVIIEANQAEAMMGFCASGAGDVNGDGYSDILIGARHYDKGQTDEGAVFVYHGSALGVNPNNAATILESNQANAYLGHSASTAGDVNGDGYSDIIAGAIMYDKGQINEGAAFVHYGSAQGVNPVAAITLESNQAEAQFGYSTASAGDLNGDGYSDVIVGAMYYDKGQSNEGAAFVYHGGKNGFFSSSTLESDQAGAQFGCSVASAGDVNGDGYSDVIAGALTYDNGEVDEGGAFVWLGGAATISIASLKITNSQKDALFGSAVASAGDVNADGYSDILIGAHQFDNGQAEEGIAMVYLGSPSGININSGILLQCDKVSAQFGFAVSGAGDVNADGYDDIAIGAPYYGNGQVQEGAAFIYYGGLAGPKINSASIIESDKVDAWLGVSVSAADINSDGFSDILIGAPAYTSGQSSEGALVVCFGSLAGVSSNSKIVKESNIVNAFMGHSVSGAGDINGDGFDDVICGLPKFASSAGEADEGAVHIYYGSAGGFSNTISKIEGNQGLAYYGYAVSNAGDINGDGFADVVVGAPYFSNGQFNEGAAHIYFGSTQGLITTQSVLLEQNVAQSEMGLSVASAGDFNGDGYSDVIVGSPSYNDGQFYTGASYIYPGSPQGLNSQYFIVIKNVAEIAAMGAAVSSAGDINADGYSDILIGAPHADGIQVDEGAVFVYGGSAGNSLQNNLRLYNTNLTTPINQTQFALNNFGAGLYAKSFLGENKGKLVWETKPAGQGFFKGTNNVITNSTQSSGSQNTYASLGLLGTELKNVIPKQGSATKVRVRVKYDPALALTGQTYGPWRYLPSYLTGNATAPVPEEGMQQTIYRKALAPEGEGYAISIYPNPTSDKLYINNLEKDKVADIKVLSTLGKTIYNTAGGESEIDLAGTTQGIYLLLIRYKDGSQSTHKIVVKK
ncbi:FG-GAP-like repeat-containing protein [Dyadobacter aurulentus]|uniref:FG-GAP-like repeat-containing protein n=1 Tax=Dyadobacter sp. UC 10 TaxID=2605428 RepID=UPI0011F3D027|nr:FG-GAP-like repeat-containing protein [Dyadobacter sp. UC 10]KAA0993119.1 T9SS type A sorting domain-containing protein [Dyadobacter sp. UC 10]